MGTVLILDDYRDRIRLVENLEKLSKSELSLQEAIVLVTPYRSVQQLERVLKRGDQVDLRFSRHDCGDWMRAKSLIRQYLYAKKIKFDDGVPK